MQLKYLSQAIFLFYLLGGCAEGGRSIGREIEIPPVAEDPYTSGRGGRPYDEEPQGGMLSGGMDVGGQMVDTDRDQDLVIDVDDNCPDAYNPEQSDIDGDGQGDACELDSDSDGIPDAWDPDPMDMTWPGKAHPDTVYAHTHADLYALDVKTLSLNFVTTFTFNEGLDNQMTYIAFDRSGVMWAVSFDTLWVCHPQVGQCRSQGILPTQFNGLTFVPGNLFNEPRDVLVGISLDGTWHRLEAARGVVMSQEIGSYPIETSSGDAFSIDGVGT